MKMQTTLPTNGGDNDTIRREISLNLQKYLRSLVDEVAYSMVISNMDTTGRKLGDIIDESQSKYLEPFDKDLNEIVREKYVEWEDCSVQVSQLRKRAPEIMNEIYHKSQEEYLTQLDERIATQLGENIEDESDVIDEYILPKETQIHESISESVQQLHDSIEQLPHLRQDITTLNQWAQYFNKRAPANTTTNITTNPTS
ncbi:kinetochore-associated protein Nsl1p [Monosporozyma unispora]